MNHARFRFSLVFLLAATALPAALAAPQHVQPGQLAQPGESDHTLQAMRDEMARSKARLELNMPGTEQPVRPYYIEYRLLDLDVRSVVAEFGALVSSSTAKNRFMTVEARVGNYKQDSSNFISGEGFRGFIGSTGSVGIDGDYDSLRQDLWIATDQAFKEAVETYSRKQAYLNTLARPSDIDDFSQEPPVVLVQPRLAPDWTSRDWDQEARTASAALRLFPEIQSSRVTYYLIYATEYLMTSEGTEIRTSHSFASIEAGMDTQAPDGMPLHHFYAKYAARPADLPAPDEVKKGLNIAASELMALRASPPAQDYTGPVLFDARAAGSLLAQVLGPSLNGSRPPLALMPLYEQIMSSLGGHSDWADRLGMRVLPVGVSLVDDPGAKDFQGHPLLGGYDVDSEGVKAQRVALVDNGVLKDLLMSRRPGPDFARSNGHGRAGFLGDPQTAMSNLVFTSTNAVTKEALKKQFLDMCREEKLPWCLVVRQMDNPAIGLLRPSDLSELVAGLASGAGAGDRLPLVVYRVYPEDGREELVRGARIAGLGARELRSIAAIGDDPAVFTFMQNQTAGFAGTALSVFGSAHGGLPESVVVPSLLFADLDVRGARGESARLPVLPAPQLTAAK